MQDALSEPLDLKAIRSRISELEEVYRSFNDEDMVSSDSDKLMIDSALQPEFQSRVDQVLSGLSDDSFLGISDLDAYLEHLREELTAAEAESAKITSEIEAINRTNLQDSSQLERDLEELKCSLDRISSEDLPQAYDGARPAYSLHEDYQSNSLQTDHDEKFEIMKLESQIVESTAMLKSLQDLDSSVKRFDAFEQIENTFSVLEVIEIDGNCINLSVRTDFLKLEDVLCKQRIDDISELSEVVHKVLIEASSETMELKNVEIFPNDLFIGDIIGDANSSSHSFTHGSLPGTSSLLQWFIMKLLDRIRDCNLRRLVATSASKSRHSFEYLDRDETIKAHLVGGVDAFIKVPSGWPLTSLPLKLTSLQSSNQRKKISSSILCKIQEAANSLDSQIRHQLLSFADEIEQEVLSKSAAGTPP
ncbi:unnamed protein product [Linum trigynum]|uniref:Uncharacterized protein n=1 Tax=Linum trigynum TaxID=586398 RepID=A0AAV2CDC7_9ROSI